MADGVDPSAKRQAERAAQADSFEAIARKWLELQRKSLPAEAIEILGTRLKSLLYPYIGVRPVKAITAQELLAALRRIETRGKHETADIGRSRLRSEGKTYRHAAREGWSPPVVQAWVGELLRAIGDG